MRRAEEVLSFVIIIIQLFSMTMISTMSDCSMWKDTETDDVLNNLESILAKLENRLVYQNPYTNI